MKNEEKRILSAKVHVELLEPKGYNLTIKEWNDFKPLFKELQDLGIINEVYTFTKFDGEPKDFIHQVSFKTTGWSKKTLNIRY